MSKFWLFAAAIALALLPATVGEVSGQQVKVKGNGTVKVKDGGYRRYNSTPWYSNADVRRQLKLDEKQYKAMNDKYVEYYTPYDKGITALPADLSEVERQQRIAELNAKFHTGVNTSTTEVIIDPQIRTRYNQLYWQYQGYNAFNDPTIQQRIKLTDEQRQAFNKYNTEWDSQMNTYAHEYATDRDAVNKNFTTTWKSTRDNINKTLTPEQRKVWTETIGESYDFPADVYFQAPAEGAVRVKPVP